MSGRLNVRLNGVQKLMRYKSKNPCSHIHCRARRLNLALVDLAKNVDGLLEAIYAFQAVSTVYATVFFDIHTEKENVDNDRAALAIPQQSDTR